jgi:iron complex outermembrane receptor protein
VGDTFGGGSQSFDSYLDPCDSSFGAAAKTAEGKARCTAAGVPVNFRQVNQAGNPVASGGGQSPTPFSAGAGNTDLKPETAKTTTLGFVFSPSYVPGLTASLDWYKIEIDNRITAVSAAYVLGQCFTQGVGSFCDDFRRDAVTGQVLSLNRGNANLGKLETEGYDLGLSYRLPATSFGQFGVRSETSYVKSYKIKSTATSDWTDYAGEYPYYRWRSNVSLDWSMGSWSVTYGMRFFAGPKAECWDASTYCSNPGGDATWGTDYNKLPSVSYHDISVGFKTPWNGKILVGVNNFLKQKPQLNFDANSGFNGGNSSSSSVDPDLPIDRFFWVRYNQSF